MRTVIVTSRSLVAACQVPISHSSSLKLASRPTPRDPIRDDGHFPLAVFADGYDGLPAGRHDFAVVGFRAQRDFGDGHARGRKAVGIRLDLRLRLALESLEKLRVPFLDLGPAADRLAVVVNELAVLRPMGEACRAEFEALGSASD
jgi:hypothetical protein